MEWNQVFEGAACVATMVDRLCRRVELVQIDAPEPELARDVALELALPSDGSGEPE